MARNDTLEEVYWIIDALVARRKELGLSHEKLASATKLSRSAISLIESKKRIPTIVTLLRIAKALDISLGKVIIQYENKQ